MPVGRPSEVVNRLVLLHKLIAFYRITALLSAAASRESFLSNYATCTCKGQDLIASADNTRQHTSAYVSILEIVLALGSCLGGFSAFSRLHVCVCGESRAEL